MQGTHLTLVLFCHLLLASAVFYFAPSPVDGSPLFKEPQDAKADSPPAVVQSQKQAAKQSVTEPVAATAGQPSLYVQQADKLPAAKEADSRQETKSSPVSVASAPAVVAQSKAANQQQQSSEPAHAAKAAPISEEKTVVTKDDSQQPGVTERKAPEPAATKTAAPSSAGTKQGFSAKSAAESILTKKDSDTVQPSTSEQKRPRKEVEPAVLAPTSPLDTQQAARPQPDVKQEKVAPVVPVVPQPSALVAGPAPAEATKVEAPKSAPSTSVAVEQAKQPQAAQLSVVTKSLEPAKPAPEVQSASSSFPARSSPVVMGGLGPLHLLATTLCSYQPDKSVADENLNQLYARRAIVRKSLFDFMSLKFTNLEKLSSRLGYGLQVVPAIAKSPAEDSKSMSPSHGWPVVGKCTAYDLKLMGEAAWCECQASDNCNEFESGPAKQQQPAAVSVDDSNKQASVDADDKPAPITSNQHAANNRMMSARSMGGAPDASYSLLPSPEESSVISKILHVSDIKNAPLVESSIYNLNLTQHQLATLEAHATSTQECRRNALRYSKALFNHLAEDQRGVSEGWPKLYAAISADDCARKRMIDIVNALSGFRTDTTSIRRDNLEFAFAMDDLRAKVLENEVNVPLTFDRHFIEVEQFLQQSVRLMLANIQPKRAKLTSMRYRSLMYGSSSDEQCLDLHQRLLARNYPSDCNPTQFGQLPDVLRMTASSLELWSIEKELSMRMAKVVDYPNESPAGQQKVKEDVNECIANLVSS